MTKKKKESDDTPTIEFGYCDIKHEHIDEVVDYLNKIEVEKYMIGLEKVTNGTHAVTNGEHMHFILHIKPNTMTAMRTHFRTKYNLGSKNAGKAYYGFNKKEIKSLERLSSYTLKDKNIRYKNYTEQEINTFMEKSFPKQESLFHQCMQSLQETNVAHTLDSQHHIDFTNIEKTILLFYMQHESKPTITKSTIRSLTRTYLQTLYNKRFEQRLFNEIYNYTMNS